MLLFFDGFDYNTPTALRWDISTPGRTTSAPRTGSHAADISGGVAERNIGQNLATVILGAAIKRLDNSEITLFGLQDGVTNQLVVRRLTNGAIEVRRGGSGGTILGTTAPGLFVAPSVWNYVELKATIHPSAGAVDVYLNGVATPVLSLSGINTRNSANSWANRYFYQFTHIDDHYLCDTAGSDNNDRLGDVKVEALYTSGAGTYTEWTPSTGVNEDNVDETQTSDGDTTYNSSATANQRDLFAMGNLVTASGAVYGVQAHINARKDDAGARELATMIRSGATEVVGGTVSLTNNYVQYDSQIFEKDPDTTNDWLIAGVNGLEAGYKLIS